MMKRPSPLPVQLADIAGGTYPAVIQILAALYRRGQTGEGACIEVSMTDCVASMMVMAHARHAYDKTPIEQGRDFLAGGVPCYDVYPTKDGFISVAPLEYVYWKKMCESLGALDVLDKQYAVGEEGERVRSRLRSIFVGKSNVEWIEYLRDKDLMLEVVRSPHDVLDEFASRGLVLSVPVGGSSLSVLKTPLSMDGVRMSECGGPLMSSSKL
jgi:crotonobetainyl-CoA:carnitine CoA-transferase CaiB-like acyl-CoA transferase